MLPRELSYFPVQPSRKKEKKTSIFRNLEKANKKRSGVRKIVLKDGKLMTNPKTILSELKSFNSSLYKDNENNNIDCRPLESFLFDTEVPSLSVYIFIIQ